MTNVIEIRNREELIERAIWHREMDRLASGEYGKFTNGEYQVCAVGCLAIGKETLVERLGGLHDDPSGVFHQDRVMWRTMDGTILDSAHEVLAYDFGLHPEPLVNLADDIFEELWREGHKDAAREWPEQFARALPPTIDSVAAEDFYNDLVATGLEARSLTLQFLASQQQKEDSLESPEQPGVDPDHVPTVPEPAPVEPPAEQPTTPGGTPLPSEPQPDQGEVPEPPDQHQSAQD